MSINKEEFTQLELADFESIIAMHIKQDIQSKTLNDYRHYHPQAEWKDYLRNSLQELISLWAGQYSIEKSFFLEKAKEKANQTEGDFQQPVIEILNSF